MTELYKKGCIGKAVQILVIAWASWSIFSYIYFGVDDSDSFFTMIRVAFGYTLPLIFVEGLYGYESAMLCYTFILLPIVFMDPGEAFLLTFHLGLIMVVNFCIKHGFLKKLHTTLISGMLSGIVLDAIFYLVNNLIAEGDFSALFDDTDFAGMLDVGAQVMVAYLILYLLYKYLPEWISQLFQVGNFRFHVKNDIYNMYMENRPKNPLDTKISRIITLEAVVLGFSAALVANALIPDLGEVIEVRDPGMVVSGAAVSGMAIEGQLYKPSEKPGGNMSPASGPGSIPGSDRFQERANWFVSRTRLGAFATDGDSQNIFVLNSEGIAFDLKLILFLLDVIMPIVTLINYILNRRTVRPLAEMTLAMGQFASDSIDRREIAAVKIKDVQVKAKDEVAQLQESLIHTVDEVIDYIQRLQEEQQLKEDLRVAQKSSEAKSNFLSNVSHEIRTPINAVLGMDEMILRETSDPRIKKYAMDIKNSGRTLVSLINDLLDFSRIEAGKLEIIPVEYEMSSVLNDLVNMISVKAEEKRLEFVVDVDETMPHLLIGDEIRIKQCIINILNNAVKYTERGSVTMIVGYEKDDDKHILLNVRVKDTGIGMKEEDMKRLYTPFERIEENRNRTIEGTGLGMSIVKQLLDMMDSELQVSSVYGEGSEFWFDIRQEIISWEPMGNFSEMYQRSIESVKEYESVFQAPDARVLVVDDTKMNLTVIEGLLEPTLVKVITAMSGAEALELVKNEKYDMIFLDQRMPGMDGIETLAAMKELPGDVIKDVPVVALTANAISGAREKFIRAGFDDYLTKPIDTKKLEATMAAMLPQDKVIRPGDDGFIYKETSDETSASGIGDTDVSAEGGTGGEAPEPKDDTLKRFSTIEEIDFNAAMTNCLKEKILSEAIRDFTAASKTGPDEIEGYHNDLDIKNYTIKVHALKSSARLIGATELSAQAAHLEACGDEEKWDEIHDLTPKLLADYRLLAEKLQALYEEPDEKEDDRSEIDIDSLNDAYAGIREFVGAFDYDSADSIVEMLEEYRLPAGEVERFTRIKDMLLKLDNEGIIKELG